MSLKNILCVAAMAALTASPALAQPTVRVEDGGLGASGRIFNFYATPGVDGRSLAAELGINATAGSNTSVASATAGADWNDDGVAPLGNPGNNPFTSTVTDGIAVAADTVFAALGSGPVSGESLVLSVEINDPIAVLELGSITPSIFAENGVLYDSYTGTFGINGDFDLNGAVTGSDFAIFGTNFGITGDPGNVADFTGDGNVTGADFALFGANFGLSTANNAPSAGGAAVPEPTSLGLAGLIVTAGMWSRRRR